MAKTPNETSSSSGTSALSLLGVAFVVLKLTGYIEWSWWWVTAPFWCHLALLLVILAIVGIVALIAEVW